ncbi:MAG: rhodanese-like domain-containing protein [Phycisphaerae bacterium]
MTIAEITIDSTMQEVLTAYPGAQRALMRRYHIGGCSSCGFSADERLGEVLKRHNVLATEEVIAHIKDAHEQEARIQIEVSEVSALLKSENPPRLIDVRMPEEQEICKLDGSIPANQQLVQEMMSSWEKDTPIVTYCHHGMRSLDAASYLIGHGFTNVRSMTGGIDAWAVEVDSGMARY